MRHAILTTLAFLPALACGGSPKSPASPQAAERAFSTPNEAAEALIGAASDFDVPVLLSILGPDGRDLVASGDEVQDKLHATTFAAQAREKHAVEIDPNHPARATLVVGIDDWPVPIPIVASNGRWHFDTKAGHDEVLNRRIGANELAVIMVSRGYVEAQQQYAQRLISTPGKHDGLAWRNADGTWGGPVGQGVAMAIEQGYADKKPFHGYYFKILKGQGPSARLGRLDYVAGSAMIGGFALVAWPAEYGVTGVQTFTVSHDGVVFQKDLGPETATIASAIDRYDPDESWIRTDDAS